MHRKFSVLGLFFAAFILLNITACKTIVYDHPTKSESEFAADKALCEREYATRLNSGPSAYRNEEKMVYLKTCLERKGWRFYRE